VTRWWNSSSFGSAVVTPWRMPVSTSARLTHSCSVCGTQPIIGAIDSTAAHNDIRGRSRWATSCCKLRSEVQPIPEIERPR
jgi:hypothetical protein